MHFPVGVINSENPPLGIATRRQAADGRMLIQHLMAINHPSSPLQYFNHSGPGESEVENLIKSPPPEVADIDDLSAVVTKCTNPNVWAEPYLYPGFIPRSGCGFFNSIPNIYLQDSICSDNNERAYRKDGSKAVEPMPQFLSNERRGDVEHAQGLEYTPLKWNRCSGAGVSEREIHIISERQRRSGMNQLLSKMRSMLPDQTAKSDKISVVAETINYIHHLQQRLRTRDRKSAGGAETDSSSHEAGGFSVDTISMSTAGFSESAILAEISLKSHASKDLFLTVKCAQKGNLLPSIILLVEGQNLQVMDAFVSTNDSVAFHSLHLKVRTGPPHYGCCWHKGLHRHLAQDDRIGASNKFTIA